jgi:hypothetical protein
MSAVDKRKSVVVIDPAQLKPVPKYKSGDARLPSPGDNRMVVTKLVTRLPKHTWRSDSRGMVFHHEMDRFAKKTKENFITLVITIVGMATALTWNEVVKALIDTFFADRSALYVKIYVAVIATLFTLVATYMISRIRETGPR